MFFNAGFFQEVNDDESNHKFKFYDNSASYKIMKNIMYVLSDSSNDIDTLIRLDSDSLNEVWYSQNNDPFAKVIIKTNEFTKMGLYS